MKKLLLYARVPAWPAVPRTHPSNRPACKPIGSFYRSCSLIVLPLYMHDGMASTSVHMLWRLHSS